MLICIFFGSSFSLLLPAGPLHRELRCAIFVSAVGVGVGSSEGRSDTTHLTPTPTLSPYAQMRTTYVRPSDSDLTKPSQLTSTSAHVPTRVRTLVGCMWLQLSRVRFRREGNALVQCVDLPLALAASPPSARHNLRPWLSQRVERFRVRPMMCSVACPRRIARRDHARRSACRCGDVRTVRAHHSARTHAQPQPQRKHTSH